MAFQAQKKHQKKLRAFHFRTELDVYQAFEHYCKEQGSNSADELKRFVREKAAIQVVEAKNDKDGDDCLMELRDSIANLSMIEIEGAMSLYNVALSICKEHFNTTCCEDECDIISVLLQNEFIFGGIDYKESYHLLKYRSHLIAEYKDSALLIYNAHRVMHLAEYFENQLSIFDRDLHNDEASDFWVLHSEVRVFCDEFLGVDTKTAALDFYAINRLQNAVKENFGAVIPLSLFKKLKSAE